MMTFVLTHYRAIAAVGVFVALAGVYLAGRDHGAERAAVRADRTELNAIREAGEFGIEIEDCFASGRRWDATIGRCRAE